MPRPSKFTLASLLLLSSLLPQTMMAQTGEPSREPILRIETGMHAAVIRRIGVDRTGKFLVTVSDDKAARVWEFATGALSKPGR